MRKKCKDQKPKSDARQRKIIPPYAEDELARCRSLFAIRSKDRQRVEAFLKPRRYYCQLLITTHERILRQFGPSVVVGLEPAPCKVRTKPTPTFTPLLITVQTALPTTEAFNRIDHIEQWFYECAVFEIERLSFHLDIS